MIEQVHVPGGTIVMERRGSGDPVLMIQGVGVSGCAWRPQVEALAGRHACVTYDSRGVGASTASLAGLSIERLAADALAILDALAIERAHVVGHSMGGVIAQQLALDAPARVRSLALLCTFSRGREAIAPSWAMVRWGLPSVLGTARSRSRAMAHLVASPEEIAARGMDDVIATISAAFGRPLARPPRASRPQLRALARHDIGDRLVALGGIPTLVMSGEDDVIAPPVYGRRLAAAIGTARYLEVPGSSHACTILAPAIVNDALRDHLARAAAA